MSQCVNNTVTSGLASVVHSYLFFPATLDAGFIVIVECGVSNFISTQ